MLLLREAKPFRTYRLQAHRAMLPCLLGSLLLCGTPALAQDSTAAPEAGTTAAASNGPQLKPGESAAMKAFEAQENEEYTLAPNDEISLDVPGRTELTGKHTIGPDGRITVPIAGSVLVTGMTRDQAGEAITQALSPYYTSVTATVSVDKYAGNRVTVLGNVEHPGSVLFDGQPTLLEAISRAGIQTQKDKPFGMPERVAIYRGQDEVLWVDLRALLDKGNSLADLRLKRNDLVYVPSDADRTVSVMGDVLKPGVVHLLTTSTLATVLAEAGGVNTDKAGQSPKIQIIDPASGKTRIIEYKELLTPGGALEVSLHPGEIIYVPSSKYYKATYVLERLNPAISAMMLGAMYR